MYSAYTLAGPERPSDPPLVQIYTAFLVCHTIGTVPLENTEADGRVHDRDVERNALQDIVLRRPIPIHADLKPFQLVQFTLHLAQAKFERA